MWPIYDAIVDKIFDTLRKILSMPLAIIIELVSTSTLLYDEAPASISISIADMTCGGQLTLSCLNSSRNYKAASWFNMSTPEAISGVFVKLYR